MKHLRKQKLKITGGKPEQKAREANINASQIDILNHLVTTKGEKGHLPPIPTVGMNSWIVK